jgi:hypothetical protein
MRHASPPLRLSEIVADLHPWLQSRISTVLPKRNPGRGLESAERGVAHSRQWDCAANFDDRFERVERREDRVREAITGGAGCRGSGTSIST